MSLCAVPIRVRLFCACGSALFVFACLAAGLNAQAQTPATTVKDGSGNVALQSFVKGQLLAPGPFGSGAIPASGSGTRLMWWPKKAAFRAGRVGVNLDGTQWDATAVGEYSVAFGRDTKASGDAAVAMGFETTASGRDAVAMGDRTTASADRAVAMGRGATASDFVAVAMGANTTASENQAVAIGRNTIADGAASLAIGRKAKAVHSNTFVWGDGTSFASDKFSSGDDSNGSGITGSQTFHVQATGGARFVTDGGTTYIPGSSTGWSVTSARSAKTDLSPADPAAILAAVEEMPISTWEYKTDGGEGTESQGAGTRHLGPMAEDFHGALPYDLGSSKDHINAINADGVALGAIRGLAQKVEAQKERIARLETKNEEQTRKIADLEKRLAALEQRRSAPAGWAGGRGALLLAFLLGGLLGAGFLVVHRS